MLQQMNTYCRFAAARQKFGKTPCITHTRTQPCSPHTPHTYPLMPADALNLKIHMKLYVNGKRAERKKERKIDDEKKEQESAEASAD